MENVLISFIVDVTPYEIDVFFVDAFKIWPENTVH